MTDMLLSAIQPDPDQPRKTFRQSDLDKLAASIRAVGLLEPIIVSPMETDGPQTWRIIAGERRWRACQVAGLHRIPVIIRDDLDKSAAFEVQMIENIMRADMSPVEEARGYAHLMDAGLSVEDISERIGTSRQAIRSRLRLLNLIPTGLDLVEKGHLSVWDAVRISDLQPESQHKVLAAMAAGRIPPGDNNAIDRLCSVLAEQDTRIEAMGDDFFASPTVVPLLTDVPAAGIKAQGRRDLEAAVSAALKAMDNVAAKLPQVDDPAHLDAAAVSLRASTARVTKLLHTQAAESLAATL